MGIPENPTKYVFSLDLNVAPKVHLNPRTGGDDYTEIFRLAFWGKDALLTQWKSALNSHAIFGVVRAAELVLLDVPFAIYAQTFAHEIDGHGGRVRELGGAASYVFRAPFPYSMETSYYKQTFSRTLTSDEATLIPQGGFAMEGYQRHRVVLSSYEAGTWSHGDQALYFGWSGHLAEYALSSRPGGDVNNWASVLAARTGLPQTHVKNEFAVSAALVELLDPLFLYSVFALFDRFIVFGERKQAAPNIRVGGVPMFATTHVDPVPWGAEYELGLLARPDFAVVEVAPRVGAGPGGQSGGVTLSLHGMHLGSSVRLSAESNFWLQPRLNVFSEGRWIGPPVSPAASGPVSQNPAGDPFLVMSSSGVMKPGVSTQLELTFERGRWIEGLRVGAKTAGLSGIDPVSPSIHGGALFGIRLP